MYCDLLVHKHIQLPCHWGLKTYLLIYGCIIGIDTLSFCKYDLTGFKLDNIKIMILKMCSVSVSFNLQYLSDNPSVSSLPVSGYVGCTCYNWIRQNSHTLDNTRSQSIVTRNHYSNIHIHCCKKWHYHFLFW